MKFIDLRIFTLITLAVFLLPACSDSSDIEAASSQPADTQAVKSQPATTSEPSPGSVMAQTGEISLSELEEQLGLKTLTEPWFGDLDDMVERRVIRVLTVYGVPRYFLDGPQQKGVVYETFREFEKILNEQEKTGNLKVHVIFMPVAWDQLIPGLAEGRGDIAVAGLTITPERQALVDFSDPASKPISEVLVTGPTAPPIQTLEDLAGQTIHVRESSSYFASLQALSTTFTDAGMPAIDIQPLSELLEAEDILEMVNAGLLPWTVVDDFQAEAWSGAFEQLTIRDDLVLRSGGLIGFAFRQDSPQLAARLNTFLKTHRQGTLFGNTIVNRYVRDYDFVDNALHPGDYEKFQRTSEIFKKYGDQYGIDYLMAAAQGYQESRLDQSVRSAAGAIGVMQLLPSTATDPNVGIPDIHLEEENIHAGIKYLDFIRSRYFSDPDMDVLNQTLMSFASYNAGPARINRLRATASREGLDPNRWFNNVEVIAAREIGRETVQYVANIYKYYTAYLMATEQALRREAERQREGLQ